MGKVINMAQEIGIINPCVAKISNVKSVENDKLANLYSYIKMKYNEICSNSNNIINKPESIGYKMILEQLGYPNTTPAGMRLLNNFKEKGFKYINYLVDAYNIISMQYCAGIGMHDASLLDNTIEIKIANGTEMIKPMFQSKYKKIKNGDLIYTSNEKVVAWIGKNDVDSDDFKVDQNTEDIVIVILGNMYTDREYTRNIANDIYETIKLCNSEAEIDFYEIY